MICIMHQAQQTLESFFSHNVGYQNRAGMPTRNKPFKPFTGW